MIPDAGLMVVRGWKRALASFLAITFLYFLQTSSAAQLDGIVTTAGEGIMPSLGAESEGTVSCLAVIYPYSTWQPNVNSSAKQPTSSPVPPYIEGSIDFSIVNTGSNTIEAPWTLGVYNPQYTEVLQVFLMPMTSQSLPYSLSLNCT